ncbi:MAG: Serine/threonine-protein kinase pkn3 [Myxococcaceae bacterium]|nr:Serine/threonine-protein kinase pkn3 [Myxococcaceae bacterium]
MHSNLPVAAGSMLAGKYRIDRVLGEGGMGVVVAATHMELDQKVAIKFLLPAALANAEVVSRFSREARAAARIRGEHVARVIDVGSLDGGAPYIVMEYLEGKDLSALLIERGPLPITDTVSYVLQACEALAEAHNAGIVHRDIKPANLFLAATADRSHIIKVLDFGISKSMDQDPHSPSGSLTRTSAVLGSAFYLSPEQLISAKTVDQRADIWALGIVLYQLLSGRVPFDGDSMPEVVARILKNQPMPLRQLRADVPEHLAAIVSHCLREAPHERFTSVLELAQALAPYGGEHARTSVDKIGRVLGGSAKSMSQSPLASSFGIGHRSSNDLLPMSATNVASVITDPNVNSGQLAPVGERTNMPWVASSGPPQSSQRWIFFAGAGVVLFVGLAAAVGLAFYVRAKSPGPIAASSASASASSVPTIVPVASSVAAASATPSAEPSTSAIASAVTSSPVASAGTTTPPKPTTTATTPIAHHTATTTTTAPTSSIGKVMGMQPK